MMGIPNEQHAEVHWMALESELAYQTARAERYRIARNVWRAMFLVLWVVMLFIIFGGLLRW